MPELKFEKRFADSVQIGEKRQTIRRLGAVPGDYFKKGDAVSLVTEDGSELGVANITSISSVRILPTEMFLGGNRLYPSIHSRDQIEPTDNEFAQADGFGDFMEMADYIRDRYGLPFDGFCIKWDEPR